MSAENSRPNWFRTVLLVVIVLLAIGAILFALQAGGKFRPARATLPNGSTVEVLGTSVGEQTFSSETKWQRVTRRLLPTSLQGWIPSSARGSCSSGSNSFTVFLHVSPSVSGGPLPWQGYEAEDDGGFRFPRLGGYCSFSDSKGGMIYGLILYSFPRRQSSFSLRLLDGKNEPLGILRVPNPIRGPFPEWRPVPFPQARTNGPVTLALLGFEQSKTGGQTSPRPKWRLESSEPAWSIATPRSFKYLDATGNEGWLLSPSEPAWKLRALVFRDGHDLLPNERLVVTNLALPESGKFIPIDREGECAGVKLKILVLASAGQFGLSNNTTRFMLPPSQGTSGHSMSSGSVGTIETWGSTNPSFLVEVRDIQPDDQIQFDIRDQDGQPIKFEINGYDGLPGGGRMYRPAFSAPASTKSVTLQVLMNRPLVFEFIMKPEDVSPVRQY